MSLALILLLMPPASLHANSVPPPSVKIFGYELEFRLVQGGHSQYNSLFSRMKEEGLIFDMSIMPYTRILRDIGTHEQCIFPASLHVINTFTPQYQDLSFIASTPVDYISLRVFTRVESPKISDLSQLTGKRIALWDGLDEDIILNNVSAKIETTPNELIRLRMLDKGRIDAILGFTPDVSLAAERLGIAPPHYDDALALLRHEGASVVCHDTLANRAFLKLFDQKLTELNTTGELRRILGEYAELSP